VLGFHSSSAQHEVKDYRMQAAGRESRACCDQFRWAVTS
jgi:hypothetical protein